MDERHLCVHVGLGGSSNTLFVFTNKQLATSLLNVPELFEGCTGYLIGSRYGIVVTRWPWPKLNIDELRRKIHELLARSGYDIHEIDYVEALRRNLSLSSGFETLYGPGF